MKNASQKLQIQQFIFVVMVLGLLLAQSYSSEAVHSIGESNSFSIYTINALADVNRALSLYGDGDYVEINDPFTNNTVFTISLWVNPNVVNDDWHGFIGKQGDLYRKPGLWLTSLGSLHYDSYSADGNRYSGLLKGFFTSDRQWVHVAWVKDNTEYRFYRNGLLFATQEAPISFYTADSSYWIGHVGSYWDGLIDEVRIWKIARTQKDIQETMNTTLQGDEEGLVGYWNFDDGTAYDSSLHSGNHGTLMGDAELVTLYGPWPPPSRGDVSGDKTVSAYDAALILQYVVGLIAEFPADSMGSPSSISPRAYIVSIPELSAKAGDRIFVPIAVDDSTGLLAGGISLKFDPTVLRAIKALPDVTLNGSYWKANISLYGELRFAFATTEPTKGQGRVGDTGFSNRSLLGGRVGVSRRERATRAEKGVNLLMVEFEVLENTEGKTSPLIIENVNLSNSQSIKKINGEVRVTPSTFALLQNYPNPFNPETWLPYKLASDSPLSISVYNAKGQLIRTINLGHQVAGMYITKDKAAYWDGRDSFGDKMASGVYYYTLQAGDFTATRKMAIMK